MKYIAKKTIDNKHFISTLKLDSIPNFEKEDYDLSDKVQYEKYIKEIESVCRRSFEYTRLMNYLKRYKGMHT